MEEVGVVGVVRSTRRGDYFCSKQLLHRTTLNVNFTIYGTILKEKPKTQSDGDVIRV